MHDRIPLSDVDTTSPESRRRISRIIDHSSPQSEPLAVELPSSPIEIREIYRPSEDELQFTRSLVEEGSALEYTTQHREGPFHPLFERFIRELQDNLNNIDPRLTPEHLAPYGYQSEAAREIMSELEGEQLAILNGLANWRLKSLDTVASQLIPVIEDQVLHAEILDVPPFYPTMDDWRREQSEKGCSNACFRMIFSALTGQSLSQTALSEQLIETYGTSVVHDEVLTNLLKTPLFEQTYGKQVSTVKYLGMDFDRIQRVTMAIKQRRPESQVFCIVNLSSASSTERTWHSGILLGADKDSVAYHDPSTTHGGAYSTADRETFTRRWTKTYNRTKFVIAS